MNAIPDYVVVILLTLLLAGIGIPIYLVLALAHTKDHEKARKFASALGWMFLIYSALLLFLFLGKWYAAVAPDYKLLIRIILGFLLAASLIKMHRSAPLLAILGTLWDSVQFGGAGTQTSFSFGPFVGNMTTTHNVANQHQVWHGGIIPILLLSPAIIWVLVCLYTIRLRVAGLLHK